MLNKKMLLALFRRLLFIRMVEEKISQKYSQQEMRCPTHLCIGQEAPPVGVCANLLKKDVVMSNHRSHGHYLAKGGDLKAMVAEIYGKVTGCSKGRGGSQHLIDLSVNFYGATPIVGGTIPVATGVAWASLLQNDPKVVVVFIGDAAVEEGIFHESLNFAALKKLPILYICENNFYSIFTHITERQPKREIYSFVKGYGIPSYQEDGNDLLKIYKLAKKVVKFIRAGRGPAFIEFLTYRLKEHCGPNDDPVGLRPQEEFDRWIKKDPVRRMEKILKEKRYIKHESLKKVRLAIQKEIDEAFDFAQKSPFPSEELSLKQVFA